MADPGSVERGATGNLGACPQFVLVIPPPPPGSATVSIAHPVIAGGSVAYCESAKPAMIR